MLTPKDDRKETFTFRKFHLSKNNSEQHNSLMPCCKWLFFHVLPPWLVLGSERTGLPFPPPVPQAAICPPDNRDHLDHHHPCHHHHYHRHHHHYHYHHNLLLLRRRPSLGLGATCRSPTNLSGTSISALLSHQLKCDGEYHDDDHHDYHPHPHDDHQNHHHHHDKHPHPHDQSQMR